MRNGFFRCGMLGALVGMIRAAFGRRTDSAQSQGQNAPPEMPKSSRIGGGHHGSKRTTAVSAPLVLSLFPGIGLLDMAFEEEGFCVVRGPDLLWGGDIRSFHPPCDRFDGIIGGPPCQAFSGLASLYRAQGREPRFGNLIPEFARCVSEAGPAWFIMENVPQAPLPESDGYIVHAQLLNNRWLGAEQNRKRRFCFGTRDGRRLHVETLALESARYADAIIGGGGRAPHHRARGIPRTGTGNVGGRAIVPGAVTASDGGASKRMWRYKLPEACELQGVPCDFLNHSPFTAQGKLQAIANGVPLAMGRAIARAVKAAMYAKAGVT